MKNILENIALILVGILSVAIIVFIVQYNLIEDEDDTVNVIASEHNTTKGIQSKSYLDALEGYGDDRDVEVDATQESNRNTVRIQSELKDDALDTAIEDKSKSTYMENLNNYSGLKKEKEKPKEKPKKEPKPKKSSFNASGEPEKLAQDEIVDEIGLAIDALDL